MNLSLMPTYGKLFLVKIIKKLSVLISAFADRLESVSLITDSHKKVLIRNLQFKDKHKGKPAFVIVNGPSLARQNLAVLKNEITFAVSGFWKHEINRIWQPTYYSLLDSNFFTESSAIENFYNNLNSTIKDTTFFIPLFRGFDFMQKNSYLAKENTFYIATAGDVNFSNDLTDVVQSYAGVSAFALSQAIYMGCSPIYLLGFDHDYLANRGVDRHFYTGGTIPEHKNTNVPLADRIAYDDEMRANLNLWKNYRVLKNIAEEKGVKILNATDGGYLDVFDRVKFEDIEYSISED